MGKRKSNLKLFKSKIKLAGSYLAKFDVVHSVTINGKQRTISYLTGANIPYSPEIYDEVIPKPQADKLRHKLAIHKKQVADKAIAEEERLMQLEAANG